jgi:hypothetical protein
VSHFTWWGVDDATGTVNFKLYLKDSKGNPLSNTKISFTGTVSGWQTYYTDSLGYASGLLPKGESMLMNVLNPCSQVVFGTNVGPLLQDQDLGTIVVDLGTSLVTVSGTVVDCSNNPVASGYVTVKVDYLTYAGVVTDGKFSFSFLKCGSAVDSAQVTAGDYGSSQNGTTTNVRLAAGANDLGQLSVCGGASYTQMVTLNMGGTNYVWTDAVGPQVYFGVFSGVNGNNQVTTTFNLGSGSTFCVISLAPGVTATGLYKNLSIDFETADKGQYNISRLDMTVTSYNGVGGYMSGTMTGTYISDANTGATASITGSFKVLLIQQ